MPWFLQLSGKKKLAVAFLFGAITSLAYAPVYAVLAVVVGFPVFLWLLQSCQTRRQALGVGWWFGWGYFTGGLYWISFALLTDVAQFGWMIPFAMFGIPAVLAFYTALVAGIMYYIPWRGWQRAVAFAVVWVAVEMLRGVLFTGFPWNALGYVWTFSDSMIQFASLGGVYGLSLVTALVCAVPGVIDWEKRFRPSQWRMWVVAAILLGGVWGFGVWRLASAPQQEGVQGIARLVQPNIGQSHKWDETLRSQIAQKFLFMTRQPGWEKVNMVVWPESALPYLIEEDGEAVRAIGEVAPPGGVVVTGSMHAEFSPYGFVTRIWNSLHIVDDKAKFVAVYDKHHLVPFGEFVPFRSILPIEKITPGQADFTPGEGVKTVAIPGQMAISPLICYEAIFPGEVVDTANLPALMVNVTNDAWYGNSSGPYQHFDMVRMRAVEHGIPMIRAANTGISGVMDAYGRVVAKTQLGEEAVLDVPIPLPIAGKTLYTRWKYGVILVMVVLVVGAALHEKMSRKLKN